MWKHCGCQKHFIQHSVCCVRKGTLHREPSSQLLLRTACQELPGSALSLTRRLVRISLMIVLCSIDFIWLDVRRLADRVRPVLYMFFFNICLYLFMLFSIKSLRSPAAIKSMCSVPWPQTSGPHFADGRLKPLQYLGMPWQGQKEGMLRPKTNLRTTKDDKACCFCFSSAFRLPSINDWAVRDAEK